MTERRGDLTRLLSELEEYTRKFEDRRAQNETTELPLEKTIDLCRTQLTILESTLKDERNEFSAIKRNHEIVTKAVAEAVRSTTTSSRNTKTQHQTVSSSAAESDATQQSRKRNRQDCHGAAVPKKKKKVYYVVPNAAQIKDQNLIEFHCEGNNVIKGDDEILKTLSDKKITWKKLMTLSGLSRGLCDKIVDSWGRICGQISDISDTTRQVLSNVVKKLSSGNKESSWPWVL